MPGREIHRYMIANELAKDGKGRDVNNVLLNNAILDMYAKCGSIRDAHLVFNTMISKDVASWNIMIMGYGMHGYSNEALGFVIQEQEFLRQMKLKHRVAPTIEQYACIIDMLGHAGRLAEAYKLAQAMSI
ncbi:hypothetical protein GH714_005110 [Hevea brasiliensis]|uniref:Pentacotripeptide-repeat region of PRORP domain-containing protein n=1 Tax=Hevea brasiliensis TaxID=3981 RepID=A0A6A6LYW5_HEVBR|nr:hypothetical protein GH714_005110 [Hevea brasiliensis]